MNFSNNPLIPLRTGPTVPFHVLITISRLQDAGTIFSLTDDGRVHVLSDTAIPAADMAVLKTHRDAVAAILRHGEAVAQMPIELFGTPWDAPAP